MQLRTVTWNIGGGKHLKEGEDPLLMASYSVDAISEISGQLSKINPDIITLQEAQGDYLSNQVEVIAQLLGYEYHFFDATSSSHIDEGKTLGNGIISKHPITNHVKGIFLNPNISTLLEGRYVESHNKGYGRCEITVNNRVLGVTTLHLLPFKPFNIELESEVGREILNSIENELYTEAPLQLIQGDFNIDRESIRDIFPRLFSSNMDEILLDQPTTPKGRKYDHALYRGMNLEKMYIDSEVKTDHYPVICEFSI